MKRDVCCHSVFEKISTVTMLFLETFPSHYQSRVYLQQQNHSQKPINTNVKLWCKLVLQVFSKQVSNVAMLLLEILSSACMLNNSCIWMYLCCKGTSEIKIKYAQLCMHGFECNILLFLFDSFSHSSFQHKVVHW